MQSNILDTWDKSTNKTEKFIEVVRDLVMKLCGGDSVQERGTTRAVDFNLLEHSAGVGHCGQG